MEVKILNQYLCMPSWRGVFQFGIIIIIPGFVVVYFLTFVSKMNFVATRSQT